MASGLRVCMGGTFDRLHRGHELLLGKAASMVAPGGHLTIGVTGDEYLRAKDKALSIMIEPLGERMIRAVHCVRQTRPHLAVFPVELVDPYGPSVTDPEMDMIIVSEETKSGGVACNDIRKTKGFAPMAIETIDLVGESGRAPPAAISVHQKLSSSKARAAEVGALLDGDHLFCRQSPQARPYAIGVTGGIAAGKSLVAKMLSEMHPADIEVIDCDKLGHSAYLSGTACFDRLVSEFGDGIVGADGEVDRRALGPIVFASPDRLEALNSIVWPVIQQMVSDQLLVSAAKVCIVEAAILLQAGWEPMVDEVWLVAVQRKVALDRLMHRNKIDEATARQKIDAQQRAMPLIESYNKSHVLIANDGTVEQVKTVLEKSWGKLIQRCDRTLPELAAAGGSSSLPARWTALCDAHGVAPAAQAAWWRKLRDRHCHRRRHLRTLHRLTDMFRHLDGCSAKLAAPLSVTLALFFHTAAFDPAKSVAQNTEDSAALARQFCSECGVGADGDVAATLIEQAPHPGNSTEGDLAHFRDVLNTPLAAESESYMAATLATHLESHHISDAEWRSTRPALLDHLYLSRPRVFVTDHFSPLEKAARRNIAAEVDELRAMCGASFDGSPKDPTHSRSSY